VVRGLEELSERVRFEVTAAAPAWVFVLRGFWPYRTVLVDGNRVEPVAAQLAFTAIRVPAGRHRVEWREELPGREISWFGPVLFLLASLVLIRRDARARPLPAGP
jgi:hypothetical protein